MDGESESVCESERESGLGCVRQKGVNKSEYGSWSVIPE